MLGVSPSGVGVVPIATAPAVTSNPFDMQYELYTATAEVMSLSGRPRVHAAEAHDVRKLEATDARSVRHYIPSGVSIVKTE